MVNPDQQLLDLFQLNNSCLFYFYNFLAPIQLQSNVQYFSMHHEDIQTNIRTSNTKIKTCVHTFSYYLVDKSDDLTFHVFKLLNK